MSDQETLHTDETEESSASSAPEARPRGGMRRRTANLRLEYSDIELYKNVELLYRYLSDRGKIRPRRQTGLCARDQRRLAKAIKRARHLALLPFVGEVQSD
ncbi:MAG: 30S ribosomal protein S18 [Candidatus Thermofonsia Clade 1 bacterium]|uniref:Small ribosomal subunit protein bS18 n=1 Tax=Candidatus Thermofonsia Clade 1 bacterium TaxID=2364210 RepID=A0A2M8PGX2_9CHLR|nr:MAG: 30S ribosomal protein S18 [Candidatus Thermofonsia Clade 1 bacterium]RMF54160.1 MAG: 30S ribosomal protein S18 [Chloroflexota bacterium]